MDIRITRTILFLFLMYSLECTAQCMFKVKGLPCINNPLEFESTTPGATNHSWNFNNEGFNNTSGKPTFTFTSLGSKQISYTCTLPNGQTCSTFVTIVIKDIPKLRLRLISNPVQCFENNMFCFVDSSLSGDNDNCIKTIKYLFSDNELITKYGSKDNPVKLPLTFCKSYLDPQGGSYDLTVEIEDCNGCIYKQKVPVSMKVELLPSIFANSEEKTDRCKGTVDVKFTNLSQIKKSDVSKFRWIFGDGAVDSTSWDSVYHLYSIGNQMTGIFSPKLQIFTGNGCMREFSLKDVILYNFKPYIVKDKDSVCLNETINFEVFPKEMVEHIKQEKVVWYFDPGLKYGYEASNEFNQVGPYRISVSLQHVCGPFVVFDTVNIIGPRAIIEPEFLDMNERYQCRVKDTVHVADHSHYYHNDNNFLDDDSLVSRTAGNLKFAFRNYKNAEGHHPTIQPYNYNRNKLNVSRVWDFGDPYCQQCTSDRVAGLNVDMNCRYSKDSAEYHVYTDWDSVYYYKYVSRPFYITHFDPDSARCGSTRIWADDSVYLVFDSVIYYGDNPLGLSAKDSSVFSPNAQKKKIAPGMFGKKSIDLPYDLRVYIPAGNSITVDYKNGSSPFMVNGPQLYDLSYDMRISTGSGDSCYFVYGLKLFKDSLLKQTIKPYHLNIQKVRVAGFKTGDSINPYLHRQLFYNSVPRCFKILLRLKDTVHPMRCESMAGASIALMPPSAKRLSIDDHFCYGYNRKVVEFNLEDTKPGCLASFVQFNPDYINTPDNWLILNNLQYGEMVRDQALSPSNPYRGYLAEGPNHGRFFWIYNDTSLPAKSVQNINVGLIVGNGVFPETCSDTFYYRNFANFPHINSRLVFADNMDTTHHICSDNMVYVTIPKSDPEMNRLADQSSWFVVENSTGDTLEEIREYYFKVKDHPDYPGQKVNYTKVARYKFDGKNMNLLRLDSFVTAIVHQYKAIVLPGTRYNKLKDALFAKGFDINSFNDTNLLDVIWNGIGVIGNPSTGSRGCIDTNGFMQPISVYYRIDSATVINHKDSSLFPADSFMFGAIKRYAYGFRIRKNGAYNFYRTVGSYYPTLCETQSVITLVVGFSMKVQFADTIICKGRIVEAIPDFRYYTLDSGRIGNTDTISHWLLRQSEAGANNREGITVWDYSSEDDDAGKPSTVFGSFPYARIGYGNPGMLLGNEPKGIYYKTPGIYTLRVTSSDSNYCRDTLTQKIYVTGPKAGFYTDISTPNCKTILELFDTSYMVDPCVTKGSFPCDNIFKWTIDWGDGSIPVDYFKSLPKQIGHDYLKNGYYTIRLIIESVLGCKDTAIQQVFIPGPTPRFIPETRIHICVNDSVSFRNFSENYTGSSQWLWNFGDGFYSPQKDTGIITHQYVIPGQYDIYLSQYDSIANTGKYCADIYPDPDKGQAKITVTVWPYDSVKLMANPIVVCVGDSVTISADLDSRFMYRNYFWTVNDELYQTENLVLKFAPKKKGRYDVSWEADTFGYSHSYWGIYCPDFDSITVFADSVLADFDIDESKKPVYCFTNKSKWADSYRWGFFHDTDITIGKLPFISNQSQNEPDRYICQNFAERPGVNWVCLEARNELGCLDTLCKKLYNDYEVAIKPPNVFTPSGNDGFTGTDKEGLQGNNVFNIYTKNVERYHLIIYNRWGEKVFESFDQTYDWNGSVENKGAACPDGTYYYILEYRYLGKDKDEPVINGVVQLIW